MVSWTGCWSGVKGGGRGGEGVVQAVGSLQADARDINTEDSTELFCAEEGGGGKKGGGGNTSVITAVQDVCCVDYTEWLQ